MWRALAFWMAFATLLAVQFWVYPGHTYLAGDSQLFVPILEHLDHPGLLSRDLLAIHPNVTYTIYDEATLFFEHVAHLSLRQALLGQLLLFRAASLLGLYLLARGLGLSYWRSLGVAALVHCGAYLPGIDVHLIDREPVPSTFAVGAIFLAAGLMARRKPLAGSIAAGVGLLYDVTLAAPFLLLLCVNAAVDRAWRRMLRGSVAVLLAFGLLLANLAQLQPGVPEPARLLDRIPPAIEAIQRFAMPQLWISGWSPWTLLWYAEIGVFSLLIFRFLKNKVLPPGTAMLRGLLLMPLFAVLFSFALLDLAHWHEVPVLQPLRTLVFFAAVASTLFWSSCLTGWRLRSRWANAALLLLAAALPLTEIGFRVKTEVVPRWVTDKAFREPDTQSVAAWAQANTWGGAMFLFPDAEKAAYPGAFRAESERAIWVDWTSRKQSAYFDSFADEWYRRWQDTLSGTYSRERLDRLLALPIDYYVLNQVNAVAGVRPVYSNKEFVVYDAHDLRAQGRCTGCLY